MLAMPAATQPATPTAYYGTAATRTSFTATHS
jgi:hypothetical protein